MLLAQAHHFFHLGEDLPFPQHQRIQASGHPQQVRHRILVVVGEQMGREVFDRKPRMAAEKATNG